MKLKDVIFLVVVIGLMVSLYLVKVPLSSIILIFVLLLVFRIFRAKIYKKIEERVRSRTDFTAIHPEWIIKLIIILFFVAAFFVLKLVVYDFFKMFGFDIQQVMKESFNRLIK